MSLFLIGLRGSGKSAAGRLAASRLGVPFVDSDLLVEGSAGRSVAELLTGEGEASFRALEREVLLEALARPGQIVATGGGCVLDPEVRAALRRSGRVLWLDAPLPVLQERLRREEGRRATRPPLTDAPDAAAELPELLARRAPLYRECADEIVQTGDRSIEEVAHVIEQLWHVLPHHDLR